MDINEEIKVIKTELRLSMNGVVSQSMREKGLSYRLNFGLLLPQIKQIAAKHTPNHDLAQALWKTDIRECMLMAGMLQPIETFYPEIATIWMDAIPYVEVAEVLCMTLFQKLPYASEKAFEWIAEDRFYYQLCGFLVLNRLFLRGDILNERSANEFLDHAIANLPTSEIQLRRVVATAIKNFAQQSPAQAQQVKELLLLKKESFSDDVQSYIEGIVEVSDSFD